MSYASDNDLFILVLPSDVPVWLKQWRGAASWK